MPWPQIGQILAAYLAAAAGTVIYYGFCKTINVFIILLYQSLIAGIFIASREAVYNRCNIRQKLIDVLSKCKRNILQQGALYGLGIFVYFVAFFIAVLK